MADESKRSAKIQSTPDPAPPHQPARGGGPAWEGTIPRKSPAVRTEDCGHDGKAISAIKEGTEQLSPRSLGLRIWSSRHAPHSLTRVDIPPNEEVRGSYANISVYKPLLLRRQVSHLDKATAEANCAGHEGDSLALADVNAAMRKAIGLPVRDSSTCDSSDGSGLERRKDEQPDLRSEVSVVKDNSMVSVESSSDGSKTLASVGIVAVNLTEKDGEEKRALHLDDDTSQEKSHNAASEGDLVRRAPSARKRHEDFVGAVKDALRHIDMPSLDRERAESSPPVTESRALNASSTQHVAHDHIAQAASTRLAGGERANGKYINIISTPGANRSTILATATAGSTVCAAPVANPIHSADKERWVRYISPEGHPYLHNASTGESEWIVSGEDEKPTSEDYQKIADSKVDEVSTEGLEKKHNVLVGAINWLSVEASRDEADGASESTTRSTSGISDADARNSAGETPLHMAAAQQSPEGLSLLVADGADVNATDSYGRTPLHAACENLERLVDNSRRARECVEFLLSSGALKDARDTTGQTALHLASKAGMVGAAEALVLAGATGMADNVGNTPLHLAAAQGRVEMMQLLVQSNRGSSVVSSSSLGQEEAELLTRCDVSLNSETWARGSNGERVGSGEHAPAPAHFLAGGKHRTDVSTEGHVYTGWTIFETEDGYTYYQNDTTGISSWDPPTTNEANASKPQLEEVLEGVEQSPDSSAMHHNATSLAHSETASLQRGSQDLDHQAMQRNGPERKAPRADHGANYGGDETSNTKERRRAPSFAKRRNVYRDHVLDKGSWDERSGEEVHVTDDLRGSPRNGINEDGEGNIEVWNRFFENVSARSSRVNTVGQHVGAITATEGIIGREVAGYDAQNPRRRFSDKGERRHRWHRRREGNSGIAWPEPLSQEDYEEVVDSVLSDNDHASGMPSRAVLSQALFAACIASRSEDAAAILYILESRGPGGADVFDTAGRTPLHHACRRDDIVMARLFCRAGADPAPQDCQGNTPLIVAAATGSTECLRHILQIGVDLNACNESGDTAAHVAVWHGNLECVRFLVENGARLNQRNRAGFTPREGVLNAGPVFSRARPPRTFRHTLEYVEGIEEALATTQAYSARPRSHTWVQDDSHCGQNIARGNGECYGSLHTETECTRYQDTSRFLGTREELAARSRRSEDQRQADSVDHEEIDRTSSNVAEEFVISNRHLGKHGAEKEEAERDQGRRGGRRARGGGARRRDSEACSDDSGRAFDRVSSSESMRVRDGTTFQPSSPSDLLDFSGSCIGNNQSFGTGSLVDQSSASQDVQYAEFSMVENRPTAREMNAYQSHNVVETRHRAAPSCNGPPAECTRGDHRQSELYQNSVRPVSDLTGPVTFKSDRAIEGLSSTEIRAGIGAGVWGAVGRAVGSLLGATNLSSSSDIFAGREVPRTFHQEFTSGGKNESGVAVDRGQGRPPTDAELRVIHLSQSSAQSRGPVGCKINADVTTVNCQERDVDDNGPSTGSDDDGMPATTTMPLLSLTPLQPPPDVLAAMGQRRRRSLTPPPDVRAALERARAERERGGVGCSNSQGEDDVETLVGSNGDIIPSSSPLPAQLGKKMALGTDLSLGPYSLGEAGGLGLGSSGRSGRSMYIDDLKENRRVHGSVGGDTNGTNEEESK